MLSYALMLFSYAVLCPISYAAPMQSLAALALATGKELAKSWQRAGKEDCRNAAAA